MIDLGTKRLETKRLVLRKAVLDDYKKAFINWTYLYSYYDKF